MKLHKTCGTKNECCTLWYEVGTIRFTTDPQVFKVTDAMNDPLTKRRYYQYSHHPEFIQKKARSWTLKGLVGWLVGFGASAR